MRGNRVNSERRFLRTSVKMGMPPCRPAVDPSILIHRDPRAWDELLGRCVDLFIEKMRGVGVGDLRSLVDYSFEGHVAFPPPAGVRRGSRGVCRRRWAGSPQT